MSTVYRIAAPGMRDDILDFANLVFSTSSVPHNFKTLIPKMYGDNIPEMEKYHFVALEDGKIKGMVASLPIDFHVGKSVLNMRFIGTVSVHPYTRGKGYMKQLMRMADEKAVEEQADIMVLGGARHRYNHYGFETAGSVFRFSFGSHTFLHAFAGIDTAGIGFTPLTPDDSEGLDFIDRLYKTRKTYGGRKREFLFEYLSTWHSSVKIITLNGNRIGYCVGNIGEVVLTDEAYLLPVIKAVYEKTGHEVSVRCGLDETERIRLLSRYCDGDYHLTSSEMVRVLNWPRVLQAFFDLKAETAALQDGNIVVCVRGQDTFRVCVRNGVPAVTRTDDEPDITLEPLDAIRRFLHFESFALAEGLFKNWLPLPFSMSSVDGF